MMRCVKLKTGSLFSRRLKFWFYGGVSLILADFGISMAHAQGRDSHGVAMQQQDGALVPDLDNFDHLPRTSYRTAIAMLLGLRRDAEVAKLADQVLEHYRGQAACIFKLPPCSGIFIDAHRPNGSFEKCSNFTDLHLNGRDYDKLKRLAAICGYKMRLCSFSLVARNLCLMRHNKILCQLPKAHKSTNFASFGLIFAETFVMFGIMSLPRQAI